MSKLLGRILIHLLAQLLVLLDTMLGISKDGWLERRI
jgi:hypothetical protein